nr:putative ribonuclease H-like domain-containing protein [Tanacetum cinerariifolium]
NRDFNEDFEDYSKDSSNDVSAASPIVPTARQNYSNSTNPISAAGPSNSNTSLIHRNSSFQDTSQSHDMLENKDIVLIMRMLEELLQFKMQKVWILVDLPHGKRAIDTKWVYINKKDERGIVVRNKARFVVQGNTQEKGIDYEEVFAPVARIEAIRLFLSYASFMGFMVYQIDVKSAFLYGTIEEEVYVCHPLGFEDPDHPNKVYKVVKVLYGLHQAPRAWYETLATYLLENRFHREQIDQTLFIKKQKGDILLVQIYVDDIIFGATNKDLCKSFEKLMKDKFQMSSMGELTFFLGLQVKQKEDGIFINQDKYVAEILKKFRSMIGSLMYLTSSRPDIMFVVCACARFQDSPFDLVAYLDSDYAGTSLDRKSTTEGCQFLGSRFISWQCKKQTVVATSSTEAGYVAGASCCAQFWRTVAVKSSNDVTRLQALVDKKRVVVTEAAITDALYLGGAEGVDCLPNEDIFTELARMGYEKPSTKLTFYKAFFSSQYIFESLVRNVDSSTKFYMYTTQYLSPALTQKVFANIKRVGKGYSGVETPLFKGMLVAREPEEQGDVEEQGNDEEQGTAATTAGEPETTVPEDAADDQPIPSPAPLTPPPQQPQDVPSTSLAQSPPLQKHSLTPAQTQGAHFPMSLLQEALDACAALARRVEHLEQDKVAQDIEIIKLKTRVKMLEKTNKAKTLKLRRLRKVGTSQKVDTSDDTLMEDVSNQRREFNRAEDAVKETSRNQSCCPVKAVVPSIKQKRGVVIRDPEEESSAKTPTKTTSKDKGKGILVEEPKPMKKKQQVELDEAYARNLQEEFNQDIDWEAAIHHVKQRAKEEPFIQRYQAKFNANLEFLLKSKEQIEEEESREITTINETPAQKVAKRRKLIEEAKEAESIKHHL